MLRKKDVSPTPRSIMKKQAHYTPDTPIKASAQAAGYLREDFRDLDHEESWILLLNGAHLPLAKKMITVGTIKSTQIDHRRIIKEALLCNATAIILFHNHPHERDEQAQESLRHLRYLASRSHHPCGYDLLLLR